MMGCRTFLCVVALLLVGRAVMADPRTMSVIEEAIGQMLAADTPTKKSDAGNHLYHIVRDADPESVDEQIVQKLTALLEQSEDVRYWAAACLAALGPKGQSAIPTLQKVLPEADCVRGSLTSSATIRGALGRMGVAYPMSVVCKNGS